MVSLLWTFPAVFIMVAAIVWAKPVEQKTAFRSHAWNAPSSVKVVGVVLLVYAILTFVYFYRTTGGASSVEIVDGRFVSMYKGQVIRISEREYRMFPNLWTRVMSAWIGMMSVLALPGFLPTRGRDDQEPYRFLWTSRR
jgi:hypothetical protein